MNEVKHTEAKIVSKKPHWGKRLTIIIAIALAILVILAAYGYHITNVANAVKGKAYLLSAKTAGMSNYDDLGYVIFGDNDNAGRVVYARTSNAAEQLASDSNQFTSYWRELNQNSFSTYPQHHYTATSNSLTVTGSDTSGNESVSEIRLYDATVDDNGSIQGQGKVLIRRNDGYTYPKVKIVLQPIDN